VINRRGRPDAGVIAAPFFISWAARRRLQGCCCARPAFHDRSQRDRALLGLGPGRRDRL